MFEPPEIPSLADQLRELPSLKRRFSFLAGRHTPHWCRFVMDRCAARWVSELDRPRLDALEISGDRWQKEPFKSYRAVAYPEYDLCAEPLEEEAFDLIIAEQVLEHVHEPWRALDNAHAMLRPGGHLLITTPFLIRFHGAPQDCSRWTALGLEKMLEKSGFAAEKIRSSSWGNRWCVVANLESWVKYQPLFHSLKDESRFPIVVWALAQK